MEISTPQIVRLKAELAGKDLEGLLEQVRTVATESGLGEPVAFESPLRSNQKPIAKLDPGSLKGDQVELIFPDDARVSISTHRNLAGALIQASRASDTGLGESAVREAQQWQTALLRGLLNTGSLQTAHVERVESGLDAVPSVPLGRRYPAVVVSESAVQESYRDPNAFWAGWAENTQSGDRRLLTRHLESATTRDWFHATFDDAWAMARAARPGDTFFGRKVAPPGCENLLMRGDGVLTQVGYRDGHLELAGFVPNGRHVPPWEILKWNEVLLDGKTPDGSPVSEIRVVFRSEEMARAEATPFLDMQVEVAYLGSDGQYKRVE